MVNKDSAAVGDVSGDCHSLSSISSKRLSIFHYRAVVSESVWGALENSYMFLNVCFAISINSH